jgi:DNA-binding MarR family transcriptional regulator
MAVRQETEPAVEAWALIWRLVQANRPRMVRLAQDLELAPMQLHALKLIEPGAEVPMRALAQSLFCDPSNVTGIVDRLESRGLIERRGSAEDRRVKILTLTPEGERVRAKASRLIEEPPPELAALPVEVQVALRDALRKATDPGRSPGP